MSVCAASPLERLGPAQMCPDVEAAAAKLFGVKGDAFSKPAVERPRLINSSVKIRFPYAEHEMHASSVCVHGYRQEQEVGLLTLERGCKEVLLPRLP